MSTQQPVEKISAIEAISWLRRRVNKLIDEFKKNDAFEKLKEINTEKLEIILHNSSLLMDAVSESIFTIMKQLEKIHDNTLDGLVEIENEIKAISDETSFNVNKLKFYMDLLGKLEEYGRPLLPEAST